MKSQKKVFGILAIARQLKEQKCSYQEIYRYLVNKGELDHSEAILIIGKI